MQHVEGPSSSDEGRQRFTLVRNRNLCKFSSMQQVEAPNSSSKVQSATFQQRNQKFCLFVLMQLEKVHHDPSINVVSAFFFEKVKSFVCFH